MYFANILKFASYFSLFYAIVPALAAGGTDLCPRFHLLKEGIKLKDAEIGLICGDKDNEAWQNIPDNQAIFHLKNFLQARGYFHPKITVVGNRIDIDPGEPTVVRKLSVRKAPVDLDVTRLRQIRGETLTPELLGSTEKRIVEQLGFVGYACPKLNLEANYDTGEIFVDVTSGEKAMLVGVVERENLEFDTEIMRRYDAFQIPSPYDARLLRLAEARILQQGTVQSTFYDSQCQPKGVTAYHKSIAGAPRIVRFGVGVETERLVTTRAQWTHGRMGQRASSMNVEAYASPRDQGFNVDMAWFAISTASRFHLKPQFSFKHENFQNYEHLNATFGLLPATSYDNNVFGVTTYFGPTLNLNRTIRGEGPAFSKFLSFKGEATVTEHTYELYQAAPRSGWRISLLGNFTNNKILSNVSAQLLRVTVDKLWNVGSFDPPLVVLGLRAHMGTTLTPESIYSKDLPTDFRHFLGGSQDIRGFSLKSLPSNDGKGALTEVDAQFEARANVLPWGLQPFLFLDGAMLGSGSATLSKAIYWSPGIGMRLQLPFGVIRTTFAHGFATDTSEISPDYLKPQLYFSFGEEF